MGFATVGMKGDSYVIINGNGALQLDEDEARMIRDHLCLHLGSPSDEELRKASQNS